MKAHLQSMAVALTLVFCGAAFCVAQNPPNTNGQSTAGAPSSAASSSSAAASIPVQLTKSLDTRKLRQGDPVEAKTLEELRTGNGVVIPRGSKVTGQVTQAEIQSGKPRQAVLGISFDKIVLENGQQLHIKTTLQAVAPPPAVAGSAQSPMQQQQSQSPSQEGLGLPGQSRSGINNPMGGGTGSPGSFPPPASPSTSASSTAPPPTASLKPDSVGIIGMHNVQLGPNSTLIAKGKDLKLEAGSEMILRVQNQ